jgi:DNA polymerase-3 subunit gamma/tau
VVQSDDPWTRRVEGLGLDGMTRQLARHCAWAGESADELRLSLEARARHLLNEERRLQIQQAFSAQAGAEVRVTIEVGAATDALSPAAAEDKRLIDRQRDAVAAIETDPAVLAFKEAFGATVRPGSIQPVDGSN